jgi:hypothetical protein
VIPYTTYKLIHLFGLLLAFSALGGMAVHAASGGMSRASGVRGVVLTMHGLGVFLLLLGGFGMLARLGIVQGGLPGWILVKLGVWTVVAVLAALPYRKPALAKWTLVALPFLGAFAAYMALYKPV